MEIVCERVIGTGSSPVACFTARTKEIRRFIRRRLWIKSSECIRKLSDCKLRIPRDRQCSCATLLAKTTHNERNAGRSNLRSVYLLLVFLVGRPVMKLILKTVFHSNGYLPRGSFFAFLLPKTYLYQALP